MKILFGMPAPDSWGGPAACEPPFVRAIENLGVEVFTETYVYGDKDRSTPILSRIARVVGTAIRFRRRISTINPDLIHLNTAFDKNTLVRDAISVFLMGRKRPKIFLKIHGSGAHFIKRGSFVYDALIRYLDNRVAGYGIHTVEELETFLPHGIDRAKFHFVKNVVQVDAHETHNDSIHKYPTDTFDILFVSRFVETKGLLETIKAAKVVRDTGARFSLTCIGDGPAKQDAENLVNALSLHEVVTFTGYISESEVDNYLARADMFVFPTRHNEGFPVALFKSVVSGLSIVTTHVRAAAEYLEDRVNCLFCTSDPTDIAEKIVNLINDKELRKRMSEANREFGRTLTPENIACEYRAVYEKVIEKG